MPKQSLLKNTSAIIYPVVGGGDDEIIPFLKVRKWT